MIRIEGLLKVCRLYYGYLHTYNCWPFKQSKYIIQILQKRVGKYVNLWKFQKFPLSSVDWHIIQAAGCNGQAMADAGTDSWM